MKENPFLNSTFGETIDDRYYIPTYQREYGWSTKLCRGLFDDLKNPEIAFIEGQVVVFKNMLGGQEIQEIVDGQQRITTTMLLYAAIYQRIAQKKNTLWKELEVIEQNIIKSFNPRLKPNKNETLFDILEEQGKFNLQNKFRMNLTQRTKWQQLCEVVEAHIEGIGKIFNNEKRKNSFIRNYEFFTIKLAALNEEDFIEAIDTISETGLSFGIITSDPVVRFMRLNQNKMDFKFEDYIKTIFFTTEGNGTEDDLDEQVWINILVNVEKLKTEGKNKHSQFKFENVFQWFLAFQGDKYVTHLKDLSKETNAIWEESRDSLGRLIDNVGDRFKVLREFDRYLSILVKSVSEDTLWSQRKDCGILGVFNGIGTQHFTTYMLYHDIDEKTQKKILKNIIIPHFARRMLYTNRSIASDLGLNIILSFYKFMNDNMHLDPFDRFNQYFFYSNVSNKTPTLAQLRNISLDFEDYNNVSKLLQLKLGSEQTFEHIIPQNFVKDGKEFSDKNFKHNNKTHLNSQFDSFSELKDCVYRLGNATLISGKTNSSLKDKSPYDKWETLNEVGVFFDDEFKEAMENKCLNLNIIDKRSKLLLEKLLSMKEMECPIDRYSEPEENIFTEDSNPHFKISDRNLGDDEMSA